MSASWTGTECRWAQMEKDGSVLIYTWDGDVYLCMGGRNHLPSLFGAAKRTRQHVSVTVVQKTVAAFSAAISDYKYVRLKRRLG